MSASASQEGGSLDLSRAVYLGHNLPGKLSFDAAGKLSSENGVSATTTTLDDAIVFPALVNSHDHLEFNLYPTIGSPPYADIDEWARDVHDEHAATVDTVEAIPVELRRFWGLLKNLVSGVTTVMDHGDWNRGSECNSLVRTVRPFRFEHRADRPLAWWRALWNRGDGPLVFHVAEGTSAKVARQSARFVRMLRYRGPLVGVHGIGLETSDARYLSALVWCPVSNRFLFDKTANIRSLKQATKILFGTDASLSAPGTIWDHLRVARSDGSLNDAELLDSVTTTPATVWNLDNSSDMVIARRQHSDPFESLYAIELADIQAVISAGSLAVLSERLYRDIAPPPWRRAYRAIEVDGVRLRLLDTDPDMLARLAAIEDAPLTLVDDQ